MNLVELIILFAISYLLYFKPDVVYEVTQQWKNDSPGFPSDFYVKSMKFGGILFFIMGVVGLIFLII